MPYKQANTIYTLDFGAWKLASFILSSQQRSLQSPPLVLQSDALCFFNLKFLPFSSLHTAKTYATSGQKHFAQFRHVRFFGYHRFE